ncbi:hypothetical protein HMPREF1548_03726 [Clostridium sp. KLE 1755]|nr:hypothetical protein HMPREF1548_03726 [Clostridium sp. KLE 1755]
MQDNPPSTKRALFSNPKNKAPSALNAVILQKKCVHSVFLL